MTPLFSHYIFPALVPLSLCPFAFSNLTETSESMKVLIFWTFFDLSGDISHNMAWSMNFDPVHHDNLPCPMNSPFPVFQFLAFKKKKSTFKFLM